MAKKSSIKKKIRVLCALSGGVDSSVAAALLCRQGYEVVGAFMKFWHPPGLAGGEENICCSSESHRFAQKVARCLGIKLYTFNFERVFKKQVVDDFLAQHRQGFTPNPCVRCNERIKFGLLLQKARELKIPLIATGHYAQVKKIGPDLVLSRGADKDKDQSYFLYRLTADQLARVIFPVGRYTKPQVRKLAAKYDLPTAARRESQEVCFVPEGDLRAFLKENLSQAKGAIVTASGKTIGRHEGLALYTIGQRKGVVGGQPRPFFVFNKDSKRNRLLVTDRSEKLMSAGCLVGDVSWINPRRRFPGLVKCQIRYRTPAGLASIRPVGSGLQVKFAKKQRALTPGQSAVFYQGENVLGGGIITEIKNK